MSHAEQREIIRVKKNPPLPVVAWEKFAFFLIVLAVLCAALVGTYIYNATRSPAYEVAVEMGVNPQRTNDQGAVAPFPYYQNKALLQDHREGLLSSEVLARVVSRPELLSIVEKEQLTPDLWKPTLSFGGTVAYLLGAEAPVFDAHAVPQTALTERILRGSAVSFDPRSQLITLRVTDYNPRFAWFVATNVTEVYREFLKNKMDTTSKPPAVASKTASILSDPTGEASVPELGSQSVQQKQILTQKVQARRDVLSGAILAIKDLSTSGHLDRHCLETEPELVAAFDRVFEKRELRQSQIEGVQPEEVITATTKEINGLQTSLDALLQQRLSQLSHVSGFLGQVYAQITETGKPGTISLVSINNMLSDDAWFPSDQSDHQAVFEQRTRFEPEALLNRGYQTESFASDRQNQFRLMLAVVCGLVMGVFFALWWYGRVQRIVTAEQMQRVSCGVPVLGVISKH